MNPLLLLFNHEIAQTKCISKPIWNCRFLEKFVKMLIFKGEQSGKP
jgi:hypothetical protein